MARRGTPAGRSASCVSCVLSAVNLRGISVLGRAVKKVCMLPIDPWLVPKHSEAYSTNHELIANTWS